MDGSLDELLDRDRVPARRRLVRGLLAAVIAACLLAGVATALSYDRVHLGPGAVAQPATGTTVVSAQGFQFAGGATGKKPARLVGVGPNATVEWSTLGDPGGAWFYDVDPLPNGNLLVVSPWAGDTRVFEYDPEAGTKVWQEHLEYTDTHDVDALDPNSTDRLLVANMRQWNERTFDTLYAYYSTQMPFGTSRRLTESQYVAIGAFWLRFHDYPSGDVELTADPEQMRQIVIERR